MRKAQELIAEICEGLNPGKRSQRPPGRKGGTVSVLWHDGAYPPPMGEGILRTDPKFIDDGSYYGWYAVIGMKKDFSETGAGQPYLGKKVVCIFDWSGGSIRGATNPPAWTPSDMRLQNYRINYA